jgi:pimeloyl-ACP methyl ester carboxylesterase
MSAAATCSDLQERCVAETSLLVRAGDVSHTIMLLHGIGSRAFSYSDLMRAWPAGPQLIAWDAPGYGASQGLAGDWPVARDYATRLADVCAALEIERVHVLAHSLGCLVAGAFGRHFPDHCGRIAFLSPALGYRIPAGSELPAAHQSRIADLVTHGGARFAALRAPRLVNGAEQRPDIVARVAAAMTTVTMPGYGQAVHMLAGGDLLADAAAMAVTTCVLTGAADVVTPPTNARQLFDALGGSARGSALHIAAGTGHAMFLEDPEFVCGKLAPFFAEAP